MSNSPPRSPTSPTATFPLTQAAAAAYYPMDEDHVAPVPPDVAAPHPWDDVPDIHGDRLERGERSPSPTALTRFQLGTDLYEGSAGPIRNTLRLSPGQRSVMQSPPHSPSRRSHPYAGLEQSGPHVDGSPRSATARRLAATRLDGPHRRLSGDALHGLHDPFAQQPATAATAGDPADFPAPPQEPRRRRSRGFRGEHEAFALGVLPPGFPMPPPMLAIAWAPPPVLEAVVNPVEEGCDAYPHLAGTRAIIPPPAVDEVYDAPIPEAFICPISREIMCQAVIVISSGTTFNLWNLHQALKVRMIDPLTNLPITRNDIGLNRALQSVIDAWKDAHRVASVTPDSAVAGEGDEST